MYLKKLKFLCCSIFHFIPSFIYLCQLLTWCRSSIYLFPTLKGCSFLYCLHIHFEFQISIIVYRHNLVGKTWVHHVNIHGHIEIFIRYCCYSKTPSRSRFLHFLPMIFITSVAIHRITWTFSVKSKKYHSLNFLKTFLELGST